MKSLTLFFTLLTTVTIMSHAQTTTFKEISVDEFDDYRAFADSPTPYLTGRGVKSDSLSISNQVFDYYQAGDQYYAIESWADYFYWLSKKYTYLFNKPEIFEHFYKMKDNVQMIKYLSFNYSVWHFPSTIKILPHDGLSSYENRFSNLYHIIKCEDDREYMEDQLAFKKKKFESQNQTLSMLKH